MAGFKPAIFFTQYHFKQKKELLPFVEALIWVGRIRPSTKKPPVFSLQGGFFAHSSIRETVPLKCYASSHFRVAHSLRIPLFYSTQYHFKQKKELLLFVEALSWVCRIRTCGMTAPKAVVLPLDDDPILYMIS